MSLERIRDVFNAIADTSNRSWKLCLLRFNQTKRNGTSYFTRTIRLEPEGALTDFVSGLADVYIGGNNPKLNMYEALRNYDGSVVGNYIYKVDFAQLQIQDVLEKFTTVLENPDTEIKISDTKFNAYVISGAINQDGDHEQSVTLVTLRTPLSILKNKFWFSEGRFVKSEKDILTLSPFVNVVIVDEDVYFLDLNAESLFGLERTYKDICAKTSQEIAELNIVSDAEQFTEFANKGHNPRRFLSLKKENITYIQNADNLIYISETFRIKLSDNKVDASDEKSVENFIKFICGKAMINPVDGSPREVPSSYDWT